MFNKISSSYKKSKKLNSSFYEKIKIFFAIYGWQLKKEKKKKQQQIVNGNFLGYSFKSYNYWTIDYLFEEIFLNKEYYFEPETNFPVILDCGANIGMSVLYFKKMFPDSKVLAFEPNPNSFKILEQNVKENNLKNVEIYNFGLYDVEKEISFFIDNNLSTLIGSMNQETGGDKELIVKTKKLSNYLKLFEVIDLVKIDVEGAEVNILKDLVESSTIGRVKEYIIEYHHNLGSLKSNLSAFLAEFENNGYGYNIRTSFKKLRSFQDVLIHFYKV